MGDCCGDAMKKGPPLIRQSAADNLSHAGSRPVAGGTAVRRIPLAATCGLNAPPLEPAWLPGTQRSQWMLVFARRLRHLDHFLDAAIATHRRIDNECVGIRIEMLII